MVLVFPKKQTEECSAKVCHGPLVADLIYGAVMSVFPTIIVVAQNAI